MSIRLVVIVIGLAGSFGGAVAQYYPPPPGYPPPPPGYYPPPPPGYYPLPPPGYYPPPAGYQSVPPRPYTSAPLPPLDDPGQASEPYGGAYGHAQFVERDANGVPVRPSDPGQGPYSPYPPTGRPLPSLGGEPLARPPADIGDAAGVGDITGAARYPADGVSGPQPNRATTVAALPPEDQPEQGPRKELPPQLRRQLVDYVTTEPAGTIIIDTPHTYLYLVLGNRKALRYGIGVGREGFIWSGTERIRRMIEWPDWHPPKEMIERQPYLPRFMAGGEGNPLGARALYLGNTLYRIHGTNQPSTIGSFVSSGCIRLTNEDIENLSSRVNIGTRVVVLPGPQSISAASQSPIAR